MGVINRSQVWAKQPQYPVGLAPGWRDGIIGVWKPFAGKTGVAESFGRIGGDKTDVAGKFPFHGYYVNGSSELSTVPCVDGLAFSSDGSTQKGFYEGLVGNGSHFDTSKDFTIAARFLLRTVASEQIILGGFNQAQVPIWKYGWGLIADSTTIRANASSNSTTQNASGGPIVANQFYTAVCVKRGTTVKLFLNRVMTSATCSSIPHVGYYMAFLSDGNSRTTFGGGADGMLSLALLAQRAWSDARAHEFCANPWQIFQPITRRLYFDVAAAGGRIMSSLTRHGGLAGSGGIAGHGGGLAS